MLAAWGHILCVGSVLFMAAYAVTLVHSVLKAFRDDAKYKLFWLLPGIAATVGFAVSMTVTGVSPMDSAGLVQEPDWVVIWQSCTVFWCLFGLVLKGIAPEGQLLPNIQSVLVLAGALVFGLSVTDTLPVPIKHYAFLVGLGMILGFGNRNVKSTVTCWSKGKQVTHPVAEAGEQVTAGEVVIGGVFFGVQRGSLDDDLHRFWEDVPDKLRAAEVFSDLPRHVLAVFGRETISTHRSGAKSGNPGRLAARQGLAYPAWEQVAPCGRPFPSKASPDKATEPDDDRADDVMPDFGGTSWPPRPHIRICGHRPAGKGLDAPACRLSAARISGPMPE